MSQVTTSASHSAPVPQFAYEQVISEGAERRWMGLGYAANIRIWNTAGQLIIIVPLAWATQLGITTLAALVPIVEMMLDEEDADAPLIWSAIDLSDPSSEPVLLPLDDPLRAGEYQVYRSGAFLTVLHTPLTQQTPASA